MYEIILALLFQLGIVATPKKPIVVIDATSGISYGVGVSTGVGSSVVPDVYYLVKDDYGRYKLVKH